MCRVICIDCDNYFNQTGRFKSNVCPNCLESYEIPEEIDFNDKVVPFRNLPKEEIIECST